MTRRGPRICICIPHWQAARYMSLCLRSIRKHSSGHDVEVIVVDNGSRDGSVEYLRSLRWIRLIERPEETHTNWPVNVFTAWDRGLRETDADYFVTMHSDVFIKSDRWLVPFLRELSADARVAGVGSWKLELENAVYAWQKRFLGYAFARAKTLVGLSKKQVRWQAQNYPRDYCAMYRRAVLAERGLSFLGPDGMTGGGYAIARQIWDAGFLTRLFPVREMAEGLYHVAHGTAAIAPEKRLHHARKQRQTERKVAALFKASWIRALEDDARLDAPWGLEVPAPAPVDEVVEVAHQFGHIDAPGKHQALPLLDLPVERLNRQQSGNLAVAQQPH